jgi:dynein heavy chain
MIVLKAFRPEKIAFAF